MPFQKKIDSVFSDLLGSFNKEQLARTEIEKRVQDINAALRPLTLSTSLLHSAVPYPVPVICNKTGEGKGKGKGEEEGEEEEEEEENVGGFEYMKSIAQSQLDLKELKNALRKLVELELEKDGELGDLTAKSVITDPKESKESKESKEFEDSEDLNDDNNRKEEIPYSVAYHKYQSIWSDVVQRSITVVLLQHFLSSVTSALEPLYLDKPDDQYTPLTVPLVKLDQATLSSLLATPEQVAEILGVPFSYVYTEYISKVVDDEAALKKDETTGVPDSKDLKKAKSTGGGSNKFKKEKSEPSPLENNAALKDAILFHISVPNYLHAVISLGAELSRLSFNCVTTVSQLETLLEETGIDGAKSVKQQSNEKQFPKKNGAREGDEQEQEQEQEHADDELFHKSKDTKAENNSPEKASVHRPSPYFFPVIIVSFLKQLQSGFLSLDFKNDGLRRHMDTLKYDVKNAEQVVYDLSLRGLI